MCIDQPERYKRMIDVGDIVDIEGGKHKGRGGEVAYVCNVKVASTYSRQRLVQRRQT